MGLRPRNGAHMPDFDNLHRLGLNGLPGHCHQAGAQRQPAKTGFGKAIDLILHHNSSLKK